MNEKLDDREIFLSAFAQASSKLVVSCGFFPTKTNSISIQPLYVCSLRDRQAYVKCIVCGTFKPRPRRAHDFQLQNGFFFRKPRRLLSIPEVAFPEEDILASLAAQTKTSYWRTWAGELGHFLWRKRIFFWYAVSIFPKVIAQAFWPMVILQSFQSALTLPLCKVKVYFSLTEHIWLLVFVTMNACQTLLSVFPASILCCFCEWPIVGAIHH